MKIETKLRLLMISAIILAYISLSMAFLVVFPRFSARIATMEKAQCQLNDIYVGQNINLNDTPYVVTTKDDLRAIGVYWLKFEEIKPNSYYHD